MNIALVIKLIGAVCWLVHKRSHIKVCDVTIPETDTEPARDTERWMCRACGSTWEVEV